MAVGFVVSNCKGQSVTGSVADATSYLTVSENGFGKRTQLDDIRKQNAPAKGHSNEFNR